MVNIPKRGLGGKTFLFMLLRYSWAPAIIVVGIFISALMSTMTPPELTAGTSLLGNGVSLLGLILTLGTILFAWLEYIHYGIELDESTFKVTHGIMTIEEQGFPYRLVHEVEIHRSVSEQIFGISTLTATITGNEKEKQKILFPWLDKDLAAGIRDSLLQKAEVEQMHIASSAI